jgi:hypothetical protein
MTDLNPKLYPKEETHTLDFIRMPGFSHHALGTFFYAMQRGYATSATKGSLEALPGSKSILYTHEKWRVLDMYLVTDAGDYSGGMTCMWYNKVPIWTMQYLGHYRVDAIPCLKAALRENYEKQKFYGGRGPEFFHHENYTYVNRMEENNFAKRVTGEEVIFDAGGKKIGWHRYQAVWMVGKK